MNFDYSLPQFVDLHVTGRISQADSDRQVLTARVILERLKNQPGLILADEVGMGKTFVALAVAVSVYLRDKKPVVIMIPGNLIKKWPNDFELFKQSCIKDESIKAKLRCGKAQRADEFLKMLDDPEETRNAIIFLTHGAFNRKGSDGWIKLAIIKRALHNRRDADQLKRSIGKYAGKILELLWAENQSYNEDLWESLLKADTSQWKRTIERAGIEKVNDDPIPDSLRQYLAKVDTKYFDPLYNLLWEKMPFRDSTNINERLKEVRSKLSDEVKTIWFNCIRETRIDHPLLIFDEAHHLKNSEAKTVKRLFHDSQAEEDAGILKSQFDRMLFLTATPFQLGHNELLHVLDRFAAINWQSAAAPTNGQEYYKQELGTLHKLLDESQLAAKQLDNTWSKLKTNDLHINQQSFDTPLLWWKNLNEQNENATPLHLKLIEDYNLAKVKLKLVEPVLKKYVVRHLKDRDFSYPDQKIKRRNSLPGNKILDESENHEKIAGLTVTPEAMLPFLLAARLTSLQQNKRPVFAEGLASSYEAFRFTRLERLKKEQAALTDIDDDEMIQEQVEDSVSQWYLNNLDESLQFSADRSELHPKIGATVNRAMQLWLAGEKVLIFCHYIATSKALRKYVSRGMKEVIRQRGAALLKCEPGEVFDKLEHIADRLTDKDGSLYKKNLSLLTEQIDEFPDLAEMKGDITDAIVRYMRTPSFLVRFAPEDHSEVDEEWIDLSFKKPDNSGVTLKEMITNFLRFLSNRTEDRKEYIEALKSVQPGGIRVKDITIAEMHLEEFENDQDNTLMANVRLCYGETKPETRQKLMKTFNSPFFPDILITSSVMAEGVDLHLNCRHIIHHDLCWNPSTLEQRTGRVDRIGAKSEQCRQPIQIYLPYISQTQDEKMYKVVTERERWFNIVMGDDYKVDAASTDKYAERVPFPEELAKELRFNLEA